MTAEPKKLPNLWVCWDLETNKIVGLNERSKHYLAEYLSYGGYLSEVVNDHKGFEIEQMIPAARIREFIALWEKSIEHLDACCMSQILVCLFDLSKLIEDSELQPIA